MGGDQRVAKKDGDGHRSHAAGNGRDGAGDLGGALEFDVTDQPRLALADLDSVDTDIDHGSAGLQPIAPDHLRPSDRSDDDVGAADDAGQIAGRSEEDTSELQSLMRSSYAVFCFDK